MSTQSRSNLTRRTFLKATGGTVALGIASAPIRVSARKQSPHLMFSRRSSQSAGRLRYSHLGGFLNFDGHRFARSNYPFLNLLYNSLIVLNENMEPQPELAESWQLSDDNLTLTVNLRQGVKFHSGRELNAEDVKLNFDRIQDPETAAHAGPLAQSIENIEVPDSYTVIFRLGRITPSVFDLMDLTYIMPPESFPDVAQRGIGTGPFQLEEWLPQDRALFVRNDDYFKSGLPLLDEVEVQVAGDPSSMVTFIESGAVDVIESFPKQNAERLRNVSGIRVEEVWGGGVLDTLINTRHEPFDNKLVRQALAHATNRERMVNISLSETGEPWCVPFPETSIAYDADVASRCRYDLEESQRLLEEAGVGSDLEIELLASTATFSDSASRAQIFAADLEQLGVGTRIVDVEAADYRERTWGDTFQVALHEFGRANRDPDTLFRVARAWWTEDNFAGYESSEYTRLVNEAGSKLDIEQRRALYRDLGNLIVDEAFMVTVSPSFHLFALRDQVQGLTFNVEGAPVYEQATVN